MDVGVCGCGPKHLASGQVVTETPQPCPMVQENIFYFTILWCYRILCYVGYTWLNFIYTEGQQLSYIYIYLKQPLTFAAIIQHSNSDIQSRLQYLIFVLLNQDGRYGNVYCTLSLASPAISLLCLLSWHAGLINIGLISCTACWPLIIPVSLLALHCGNSVQLINNNAKGRKQIEKRQWRSVEKSNCSNTIKPH